MVVKQGRDRIGKWAVLLFARIKCLSLWMSEMNTTGWDDKAGRDPCEENKIECCSRRQRYPRIL